MADQPGETPGEGGVPLKVAETAPDPGKTE